MAFIDQGEFEAMKTLGGWLVVARCDEYPFRAKIKFELSLFEQESYQERKKNTKNGTFAIQARTLGGFGGFGGTAHSLVEVRGCACVCMALGHLAWP